MTKRDSPEIDTSVVRIFRENPAELIRNALFLGLLASGLSFAVWYQPDQPSWLRGTAYGISSLLGILGSYQIFRVLVGWLRVLELSPAGLLDTNLSAAKFPWTAIEKISIAPIFFRGRKRFSVLELEIKSSVLNAMHLTRNGRRHQYQMGKVWVPAIGRRHAFDEFATIVKCYARDHGQYTEDSKSVRPTGTP